MKFVCCVGISQSVALNYVLVNWRRQFNITSDPGRF